MIRCPNGNCHVRSRKNAEMFPEASLRERMRKGSRKLAVKCHLKRDRSQDEAGAYIIEAFGDFAYRAEMRPNGQRPGD